MISQHLIPFVSFRIVARVLSVALLAALLFAPGLGTAFAQQGPPPPEEGVQGPPPEDFDEEPPAPAPRQAPPAAPTPGPAAEPPAAPQPPAAGPADVPPAPPGTPTGATLSSIPATAAGGIVMNFENVSLDAVLNYLSEAAGFVVVKSVPVDARISVTSRRPLSAADAISVLNTLLKEKGYAAIVMGRTLKIVPLAEAKKANIPVRTGSDPAAIELSDRIVTQIIPLRSVDAAKLKQDITPLLPSYAELAANAGSNALILTSTEADIRRIVEIVRALDAHLSATTDVKVFPLRYATATTAARLINEVFKQDAPASSTQQQIGPFGIPRGFRGPGGEASSADTAQRTLKVTASGDDRTNTVVVTGPGDVLKVVEAVVTQLDSNPTAEQSVFVYPLKNGDATTLETALNKLFGGRTTTTSTTGGRTQGTTGRTGGAQGVFGQMAAAMASSSSAAASASVSSDLYGQVYVVADKASNALMVMTSVGNFDRVRGIIAELDRSVPQVLIKVLIAEVTHTDSRDLGAEFSVLNLRASGRGSEIFTDYSVAAATGGLVFKLVEKDITAALRAIEEVGKLDVLSRPYILSSDNQQAKITVGQRVPFITNTRTTDTGATINTIQYEDIGIILTVTPHINPDGLVTLDVAPEISTLTGDTVPISETVNAPVFAKRSATSRVAIHDGQTIVIGGMMQDQKTDTIKKVPLLGDIPYLGALFRRTTKDVEKTELLIFLTPHVAQEAKTLQGMSQDEMKGVKLTPNAVAPGAFDEHMKGMQRGAAQPQESATP